MTQLRPPAAPSRAAGKRTDRRHPANGSGPFVVQARCLCWLALLAEAHEDQASDAERRGDTEQAMGWFADSMRLRDVIGVVSSIEIPLPGVADDDCSAGDGGHDPLAA